MDFWPYIEYGDNYNFTVSLNDTSNRIVNYTISLQNAFKEILNVTGLYVYSLPFQDIGN
jgi:hypothetical protein